MVYRLSCPVAGGTFLDQELNLHPLRGQVDSEPLDHQGGPAASVFLSEGTRGYASNTDFRGPVV